MADTENMTVRRLAEKVGLIIVPTIIGGKEVMGLRG